MTDLPVRKNTDKRTRDLERLAAGGDLDASASLAVARLRSGDDRPSFGGEVWTVRFQPTLPVGTALFYSARKGKKGKYHRWANIPERVVTQIGGRHEVMAASGTRQAVLDPDVANVVLGDDPLPEEWILKAPPRVLRVLRPDRYKRPGLVVELDKVKRKGRKRTPPVPTLEWDDPGTRYLGDENDGVFYGVWQQSQTRWWALATVDSNTGGFTDTLAADYGYRSEKAAMRAARDAALEWLHFNNVEYDDEPEDYLHWLYSRRRRP
jgi:hypothetical protein